jgi:signal transduction histidine kinase
MATARPGPTYGRRFEDRPAAPVVGRRGRRLGPRLDPKSVAALGRLGPLVTILRWASLAVGVALVPTIDQPSTAVLLAAAAVLLANTIFRTVHPLRLHPATWRAEAVLLIDLAITVAAIGFTGDWSSPFILTPLPTVILAAYAWGYREGLLAAALTAVTIQMVDVLSGVSEDALRIGVLTSVIVVLAAFVGGFTRQLWLEAETRHQETLDQATRMSIANDLLHALHDVVQTLPASLDLSEVVDSARDTFRQLLEPAGIVVVIADDASNTWRVELADGLRLPNAYDTERLPRALARALAAPGVVRISDLPAGESAACDPASRSVLAAALRAQDRIVGIVAVEHPDAGRYSEQDANLFAGLASSLALAVDNARWFGRLRTLGAEAERARIARDLHDRLAQSLAYVGFELDRLAAQRDDPELRELHQVVRGVVGELRETLYQLRATVTEGQTLAELAPDYVDRWSTRTGVPAEFAAHTAGRRLPIQVEQELWRILQESLTNVERHADASHVGITWEIEEGRARLEVRDDGRGMDPDDPTRERYGLVGIRERADAVGGLVTLTTAPGNGTTVLVQLEVKE